MKDDRSQSESKSADAFPTSLNGQITDVAGPRSGAAEAVGAEGEEDPSEGDPS